MPKITLTVELEYSDKNFPKDDSECYDWFLNHILYENKGKLMLHSNEMGAFVGKLTVLSKSADLKQTTT